MVGVAHVAPDAVVPSRVPPVAAENQRIVAVAGFAVAESETVPLPQRVPADDEAIVGGASTFTCTALLWIGGQAPPTIDTCALYQSADAGLFGTAKLLDVCPVFVNVPVCVAELCHW